METQMQSDLLDRDAVCAFFGGTKPLNAATLYRGIRKGRYPKPVKVGPGSSRWLRSECEAALERLIVRR
jgi:predicted DNA-binding transcriptional regulator AlpA